jgi:glycosyltransferase involved in cell wall biosynthesis
MQRVQKISEMTDMICLDENYSTTREVTQEKPEMLKSKYDKFDTVFFLPESKERKGEGGLRTKGYFKKSYDDKPLISIITVVFNGEKFLEETIESVINQIYDNVEYIIIDGGSTDSTLDIVKQYEDRIDYWVSETDGGIYDAMNKGITLCSGKIVGIVNADDVLYKNATEKVAKVFIDQGISFTCGTVHICNEDGEFIRESRSLDAIELNTLKYKQMPFPHPTVFVSINTYKNLGLYDTEFKVSADYDFVLKLLSVNSKFSYIQSPISKFRLGGVSGGYKSVFENRKVLLKHHVSSIQVYSYFLPSLIKRVIKTLLPESFFLFLKKLI